MTMVSREFREMLSRIKMSVKSRYFAELHQTLFYNEDTGMWLTREGRLPITFGHVPTINELVNFTKL